MNPRKSSRSDGSRGSGGRRSSGRDRSSDRSRSSGGSRRSGEYRNKGKQGTIHEGKVIGTPFGGVFIEEFNSRIEFTLSNDDVNKVLDGDIVTVKSTKMSARGKVVVSLVKINSRSRHSIMARYVKKNNEIFAVPYSARIPRQIHLTKPDKKIPHDCIVEVKLLVKEELILPDMLEGEIVRVVGGNDNGNVEVDLAISEYNLNDEFPANVINQAQKIPDHVMSEDKDNRRSLLHLPFVTIDGSDARDYDDAVFCAEEDGGWRLWVAIADVSHYVTPASDIDKEAVARTSSVYFPNKVVPMLPENLSNGVCSLNPNVERLVLVCEMKIDRKGVVRESEFYSAVIYSRFRLIYEDVSNFINSGATTSTESGKEFISDEVKESLTSLHKLTEVLLEGRRKRNALDFRHLEEIRVNLDNHGKVTGMHQYQRGIAHLMIEEAMLVANVCAANYLAAQKAVFCYRVHPPPEQEKLNTLRLFFNYYNIKVPTNQVDSATYCKILDQINKYSEAGILEMVVLKSMQQALYRVSPGGHFGLNYDAYTHFTSPIRRYPDLLTHRAIKKALAKKEEKKEHYNYSKKEIDDIAALCSTQERNINKAVWQVVDALKCRYLEKQPEKVHQGTIVYISERGFFVRLNDIPVEGMVVTRLLRDDYYKYDAGEQILQGVRKGKVYRMGNSVSVKVDRIRIEERKVDFTLIQ